MIKIFQSRRCMLSLKIHNKIKFKAFGKVAIKRTRFQEIGLWKKTVKQKEKRLKH